MVLASISSLRPARFYLRTLLWRGGSAVSLLGGGLVVVGNGALSWCRGARTRAAGALSTGRTRGTTLIGTEATVTTSRALTSASAITRLVL